MMFMKELMNKECQNAEYVLQFLWRNVSSDFDVTGPYFTLDGFKVRAFLCDGASSNLALLKALCNYNTKYDISPFFISPFDSQKIHLIICPSHQVSTNIYFQFNYNVLKLKNMIAALYSSRDNGGTKDFVNSEGIHFGWETIEEVYRMDMKRAKNGQTRKVPKLKYSYIVRDSWTRLNVLPAKIMQVSMKLIIIIYYGLTALFSSNNTCRRACRFEA